MNDTQLLMESPEILKQKCIFIGGFLTHKYIESNADDEEISSEFISELNHGGLHLPTLDTVYFVHCAMNLHNKLKKPKQNCCKYFQRLIACIDAPLAANEKACKTLANTIFKAYSLDISDTEKRIGCLRRKEKLSE